MRIINKGLFKSIREFEFIPDPRKNKPNLGIGSFGEVKLGKNKKDGKLYAIKIVKKYYFLQILIIKLDGCFKNDQRK